MAPHMAQVALVELPGQREPLRVTVGSTIFYRHGSGLRKGLVYAVRAPHAHSQFYSFAVYRFLTRKDMPAVLTRPKELLLSLEKEWLQEPRVVGACVVWPLDEEEAPPLALEVAPVEGATRKRRDGSICAQFCLAQRTDVLPLDQLTYSRAADAWRAVMAAKRKAALQQEAAAQSPRHRLMLLVAAAEWLEGPR